MFKVAFLRCIGSPPGAPQLASSDALEAFKGVVLGGHVGMDAGLSAPVRVLPGVQM